MGAYYSITTCPTGQVAVAIANGVGVTDDSLRRVNACGCQEVSTGRTFYAQGTCSPVPSDGTPFEVVTATDARPAMVVTQLNCADDQDIALHWVNSEGGGLPKESSETATQDHYCATTTIFNTECEAGLVGYTESGRTTCMPSNTACQVGGFPCLGGSSRRFATCTTDAGSHDDSTCTNDCRNGETCIDPSGNPLPRRARRRALARQHALGRATNFCPTGETACPILGLDGVPVAGGSGECVDVATSLDHCGACNAACSVDSVVGAVDVSCEAASCIPLSCEAGLALVDNACISV